MSCMNAAKNDVSLLEFVKYLTPPLPSVFFPLYYRARTYKSSVVTVCVQLRTNSSSPVTGELGTQNQLWSAYIYWWSGWNNPLGIHLPGSLEAKRLYHMKENIHPDKVIGLSDSWWAILHHLEPSKVWGDIFVLCPVKEGLNLTPRTKVPFLILGKFSYF